MIELEIKAFDDKPVEMVLNFEGEFVSGADGGEYERGYEDGKNSVPQFDRYMRSGTFITLNMFKTAVAELNLENWGTNSFLNLLNITLEENANTTVEHLTVNTPNCLPTSIQQMLYCSNSNCTDRKLKRLTLNMNLENCTNFSNAFGRLAALETIEGTPLNFSSATTGLTNMFSNCSALTEFGVVANSIKISFSVASASNLSTHTIRSIIEGLADLTGGTAQTLDFHADIVSKLTDEQQLAILLKNWTVI